MTDRPDERWHRCKAAISRRISPEDAATWLAGLQLREVQPDRVVLGGVPNTFFRNRIASRFRPLILESLRDSFEDIGFAGDPVLELQVGPAGRSGDEATPAAPGSACARPGRKEAMVPHRQPRADGTAPEAGGAGRTVPPGWEARLTFDAFLAAPGNDSALEFARQVAREPGQRFNPLVLVGGSGLGKTHLLQAIAGALRPQLGVEAVLYVTGEAFKNEVLDGITRKRMPDLRERYRAARALLLDDLEFLLVSPKAQEELLHTFDVLHRGGRQLVFAADRYPRALGGLSEALRSRLEMGLLAEVAAPDAAARLALVERRAAEEGIALPPDAARLLAERITYNLRRLEGAVVRLGAHAALHGQAISAAFVERYAAPFFDTDPATVGLPVPRETILERVADRFGVTVRALKGRGRSPSLAGARRIAVHLLKTVGECSYSEIGALLGQRSHSTIVHAHQTLQGDLARDAQLQTAVQQLARSVTAR